MIKAPDVTLLYVMFAFIASYAILKRFLFVPLGAILAEREREEREASRIHQESLKELERTIAEAERRLAEARREALREREALQDRVRRDEREHHVEKRHVGGLDHGAGVPSSRFPNRTGRER